MFGIKTFVKNNILYPHFLFPQDNGRFPEKPVSRIRIKARLLGILTRLKDQKKYAGLGNLVCFPHKAVIDVWSNFLPYNPNNLGNWSIKEVKPNQETSAIERELIWQMIDLYGGSKNELEGYATSGGTEANIFSAWLGRNFLESKGIKKEKIILIKTSLTHYSIEKAADIIGVKTFITPLNEENWGMDIDGLEKNIRGLQKRGYKGFLLPLTLGYTLTGTFDPFERISCLVRDLKKGSQGLEFFLWLDAAINGLVEPFLNKSFRPFAYLEIQTFLTDFHKFGFAPIPAGLILYRKELRPLIEKPIDYLAEKDSTLLGSRSGIAPAVCWGVVNRLGKSGFKKLILRAQRKKEAFIEGMKEINGLKIITDRNSLNCALIKEDVKLNTSQIEKEYGLLFRQIYLHFTHKKTTELIAKAFFNSC